MHLLTLQINRTEANPTYYTIFIQTNENQTTIIYTKQTTEIFLETL